MNRRWLPVALDVRRRTCVVVGGGAVGTRKALTLARAGAQVRVIAPRGSATLARQAAAGRLRWVQRPFRAAHVAGAALVVAATDDPAVNAAVVRSARRRGIPVCDASSAARSDAIFGALLERAGLTLAVFSGGRDPAGARRARDHLAALVGAFGTLGERTPRSPLILIAHGSRDARWRASVERVAASVRTALGKEMVWLAYMDCGPPSLSDVVRDAVCAGHRRLRVLPLFLATEGHVDRDVRPLVHEALRAHPGVRLALLPPVGQQLSFREALYRIAMEVDGAARGSGPPRKAAASRAATKARRRPRHR